MLKIGDLARAFNVTVKSLRFYEKKLLLTPAEVDQWTGYRYYNDENIKRLSQILYLKSLGFSLKEIGNLNEDQIKEKTVNIKNQIEKLRKNLFDINSLSKNEKGEFIMKNFVNDERAIGKWQKVAVVKNKEEYFKGTARNSDIFPFDTLYLMENGQEYWVVSWTKGYVNIKGVQNPYEIEGDLMFLGVVDRKTSEINDYVVYKKLDNKRYKPKDFEIKDDLDMLFVMDKKVIGFWQSCDFVPDIKIFNPDKKYWKESLFVLKLAFSPDGEVVVKYKRLYPEPYDRNTFSVNSWTKNYILSKEMSTKSKYQIKTIDGKEYLFMEWKSGDYKYAGKIKGYYVFKKM